ncbi:unnamed protein product, partial [Allacma fusca]
YSENWSREKFKIIKIQDTLPYTYLLQDFSVPPEEITGQFYPEELELAPKNQEENQT